jgi:regulator of cell morphogenesis and NO signaling
MSTRSLADIVSSNPAVAPVLDRLGLDYCCHGERSLADACTEAGLDVDDVTAAIAEVHERADTAWASMDVVELVDHIVGIHHAFLHDELPLVDELARKVRDVHRERHPELDEVASIVSELRADLEPHLLKEERVLFPAIRALAEGRRDFPFGSIGNPIRMMLAEHDRAGELLARLRVVTAEYAVPADACASYASLYSRLAVLELDTHLHVHKENHALFPAVLEIDDGT